MQGVRWLRWPRRSMQPEGGRHLGPYPSNPRRLTGDERSRTAACRRRNPRSRPCVCSLEHGTGGISRMSLVDAFSRKQGPCARHTCSTSRHIRANLATHLLILEVADSRVGGPPDGEPHVGILFHDPACGIRVQQQPFALARLHHNPGAVGALPRVPAPAQERNNRCQVVRNAHFGSSLSR